MKSVNMKRCACFLISIYFLLSCFGCGRNNGSVRIKKDISEVIKENEEYDEYLYIKDMLPTELNDQWGNTLINILTVIPDADSLPIALYGSETFSEAQIKGIIDRLAGESVQIYETGQPSISYYKQCLEEVYHEIEVYEKELSEFKEPYTIDGYNVQTGEEETLTIDEAFLKDEIRKIKEVAAKYASIIENYKEIDRQPIELHYENDDLHPSDNEMIVKGCFDHLGSNYIVHTYCYGKKLVIGKRNLTSIEESDPVSYSNLEDDGKYENRIGLSREEAIEIAQIFADTITEDMKLRTSYPAVGYTDEDSEEYVWQCYFTKDIYGVEVSFEHHEINSYEMNRIPFKYESLSVAVSSDGVIGLTWQFPLTYKEQVADDVKLMPLTDVLDVAKKYFSIQEYRNLEINKMQLSYMRIDKQGDEGSFYYVPVWDFYGSLPKGEYDPWIELDRYSFLTINALDGTIIDRSLGY